MRRHYRMLGLAAGAAAAVMVCAQMPADVSSARRLQSEASGKADMAIRAASDVDRSAAVYGEPGGPSPASLPDDDPQFAEQVHVIMRDLGLTEDDAIAHVEGTMARLEYREAAYAEIPECVGGFAYDSYTSTMTVYSLSEQCDAELIARADDMPFGVTMERTEQSIDDLQALADDLNVNPPADLPELVAVSVDDERNAILLRLADSSLPEISDDTAPDPSLVASRTTDPRLDGINVELVREVEVPAET